MSQFLVSVLLGLQKAVNYITYKYCTYSNIQFVKTLFFNKTFNIMKFLLNIFLIFLTCTLIAQEEPECGLSGPGTNGSITPCEEGEVTYTVPHGCCTSSPNWFWEIENLIVDQNTPFGTTFSITAIPNITLTGTIIEAFEHKIIIDWDCPEECPETEILYVFLHHCGQEFFNPVVRISCETPPPPPPPCESYVEVCFNLECNACIGVVLDGNPLIIQQTSNNPETWCFDLSRIETWFPCNNGGEGIQSENEDTSAKIKTINQFSEEVIKGVSFNGCVEKRSIEQSNASTNKAKIGSTNSDILNDNNRIKVSPNPTASNISITLENGVFNESDVIQLFDNTGKEVLQQRVSKSGSQFELNISHLTPALYFLKIKVGDQVLVKKILKQ